MISYLKLPESLDPHEVITTYVVMMYGNNVGIWVKNIHEYRNSHGICGTHDCCQRSFISDGTIRHAISCQYCKTIQTYRY